MTLTIPPISSPEPSSWRWTSWGSRERLKERCGSNEIKRVRQKLTALNSMKEKGLITDEEYQAMRKKALGL